MARACAFLVALAAAGPATAADGALLVVVEASPELSVDAGQVRRAIGTELRDATVAPSRLVSDSSERALIVSVDRERITMSLRATDAAPVTRAIPAPADAGARLHAIAWLAGNLARDQVTGIVTDTTPPASALGSMVALESAPASAPAASTAAVVETQPPAYQPAAMATLATHAESTASSPATRWSVGIEAGAVLSVLDLVSPGSGRGAWASGRVGGGYPVATLWRLEMRHFSTDRRFLLGLAAEGATGEVDPERFGAGGFCGWNRQRGKWATEATLGLGLDFGPRVSLPETVSMATESTTNGFTSSTTVTRGGWGGSVYGMGAVAASYPIGDAASVFLRVGAHLSAVELPNVFVWTALGVNYGLW